jgi:translocation and assembly module TamB
LPSSSPSFLRLGRLSGGLVAGVVLAAAALPWWLDLVLPRILSGYGITYAQYERVGYSRFAVTGLKFGGAHWSTTLDRVEIDTPLLWGWRHWRKQPTAIVVDTWRVDIPATAAPQTSSPSTGWQALRRKLLRIGDTLSRWVPLLHAGAGQINLPQGRSEIGGLSWTGRELQISQGRYQPWHGDVIWTLPAAGTDTMKLRVTLPEPQGHAELASEGAHIRGTVRLWQQAATLTAEFAPTGWWPTNGRIDAPEWNIPGEKVGLGARYARLRGHGQAEWKNARFTADFAVEGEPAPGQAIAPLHAVVQASGDATAVSFDRVEVTMPGLTARLSEPVHLSHDGTIQPANARFTVAADLAALPWGFSRGRIEGEARVAGDFPTARNIAFSLTGTDVARGEINLPRFETTAELTWPRLRVSAAKLIFSPEEQVALHGEYDFASEQVTGVETSGSLAVARLRPWFTPPGEAGVITFSAAASGTLPAFAHHGRVHLNDWRLPPLQPLALTAEWQGRGADLSSVKVSAQAGASTLSATGSLEAHAIKVDSFQWTHAGMERLQLTAPVALARKTPFASGPIKLTGPLGQLQLQWIGGQLTDGAATLQGFSSTLLADLVRLPGPAWSIRQMDVAWSTTETSREFSLHGQGQIEDGPAAGTGVIAAVRREGESLRLEQLDLTTTDGVVAHATGQLPLRVHPGETPLYTMNPAGAVALDLTLEPSGPLLTALNQETKLAWVSPRFSAQVTGPWQNMSATLQLAVTRVARPTTVPPDPSLLTLENVSATLRLNAAEIVLENLSGLLGGQPIRAGGRLRRPADGWPALRHDLLLVARENAELDLSLPETDLTSWARDLTATFLTKGTIAAELHLRPGTGSFGWVRLKNTSTRPIPPLGAIQDVSAELQLDNDTLVLPAVEGRIGGQPVRLHGRITAPFSAAPAGELALTGTNIPLVRQKGLLVRADLDLQLTANAGRPPKIGGQVRLRDSLLFADIRGLAGSGAPHAGRAPYFEVEEKPFRDWTLAVQIAGDRFLRVRSPVFHGVASAHFKLGGTLGDPRALGDAVIDEGYITLPYVTFRVQQGRAELSLAHEFDPQLSIRGTARSLGYDLRMEVTGAASAPRMTFTSSPALDARDALLLVLTGVAPRQEITYTTQQRATQIGSYLGSRILAGMHPDPADTPTFNLISGEKISRQGRQTYRFEYETGTRWSLLGEYDEFDEYNADLKWKLPYFSSDPADAKK